MNRSSRGLGLCLVLHRVARTSPLVFLVLIGEFSLAFVYPSLESCFFFRSRRKLVKERDPKQSVAERRERGDGHQLDWSVWSFP